MIQIHQEVFIYFMCSNAVKTNERMFKMKIFCRMIFVIFFIIAFSLQISSFKSYAKESALKLTVGGASVGGFWSTIGEAIGSCVRKAYPGSCYSYEPGSGLGNIVKVTDKKIEVGIAYSAECLLGLKGERPFKESHTNLRALFACIPNSIFHIVITKSFADEYGIQCLSDIAKKKAPIRMSVNQKGNITENIYRTALEGIGITYKDIESYGGTIYFQSLSKSRDLIKDRNCDTMGAGTFVPESKALDVSLTIPLKMLYLDDSVVKHMIEVWGEREVTIPPGAYKFQDKPYKSMYMKTLLICDSSLPDDVAYKIVKSVHVNFDILKNVHKMMNQNTFESMVEDTFPLKLHPGAMKYYKEAGIIK